MRRMVMRLALGLVMSAGVAGCGSVPPAPVEEPGDALSRGRQEPPREPASAPGAAVDALLARADRAWEEGQTGQAAVILERALRLSPDDPAIWYRLARVRLEQGRHALAASLARRSLSLSGGDGGVAEAARELLEAVCSATGGAICSP